MRIIFMGTPDFAVPSLDILHKNGYEIVGVVTTPDKKAGRGQKIQESPVKKYAVANNLNVLQPEKLRAPEFITELEALQADLFVVVAFRMLPKIVWQMPPKGTFNLHSSLLPQYRGAAPINHAIINGEKTTGVTTFYLNEDIDTGNIIAQKEVNIDSNENAGNLHDRLMEVGAGLVLETVQKIENGTIKLTTQEELIKAGNELKAAPKIFKEDCHINWELDVETVYNFIRGLSPYPAAWSEFINTETQKVLSFKVFDAAIDSEHSYKVGNLASDGKNKLTISCNNGAISINEIQLQGKKRMNIQDFLRGFDIQAHQLKL